MKKLCLCQYFLECLRLSNFSLNHDYILFLEVHSFNLLIPTLFLVIELDVWWTVFKDFLGEEKNVSDWRTTLMEDTTIEEKEQETEDGFDNFENEMTTTPLRSSPSPPPSSSLFVRYLSDFLFSKSGSKYKANFRFDGNLTCNDPAPPIQVIVYLKYYNLV